MCSVGLISRKDIGFQPNLSPALSPFLDQLSDVSAHATLGGLQPKT